MIQNKHGRNLHFASSPPPYAAASRRSTVLRAPVHPTSIDSLNFEIASISSITRVCRFCSSTSQSFPTVTFVCCTSILLLRSVSSSRFFSSSFAFSPASRVFSSSSSSPSPSCSARAFYNPPAKSIEPPANHRAASAVDRPFPPIPRSPPALSPSPRFSPALYPTIEIAWQWNLELHDLLA